ncbi:MAG: IspD/TarI family cytidylyltransferase [Actinobacteria bacterium]|nr:IspD/TarI family cytidylyltransferase [Actinomycetota bacterium]
MSSYSTVASVVLAAGSGTRFGNDINKVWLPLKGRHVISRSLTNASAHFKNSRIILVINPDDEDFARKALAEDAMPTSIEIVYGGASRHESEFNALQHLKSAIIAGEIETVLIHDGARPLATPELFSAIADAAAEYGGAIPTIALDSHEMDTTRGESVARVQTPQGFKAKPLLEAYEKAAVEGFIGTDTSACMEKFFPSVKIRAVPGDVFNFKITYPQDLAIAELLVPLQ